MAVPAYAGLERQFEEFDTYTMPVQSGPVPGLLGDIAALHDRSWSQYQPGISYCGQVEWGGSSDRLPLTAAVLNSMPVGRTFDGSSWESAWRGNTLDR